MPNPHHKCEICLLNHRPGNCKAGGHSSPDRAAGNLHGPSRAVLASDLTRLLGNRGVTVYRDPFSRRAEEITRQAILRADSLGMEHYGPAPEPLNEKRDLYRETIEELLDAIYYLTRQVAQLEDLKKRSHRDEGRQCRHRIRTSSAHSGSRGLSPDGSPLED